MRQDLAPLLFDGRTAIANFGKSTRKGETITNAVSLSSYSIDVIENVDGNLRVVELGDGQVSDRKTWSIDKFVELLMKLV